MSKNFAIIGVAGYIAPRHLAAIKQVGGNLVCAYDPHDSVGILDSYFPNADFFTEFERFDRHIDKIKRKGIYIDYLVVCSPNYLHDSHCRYGLRSGMDVICEKPLVLNTWNAQSLIKMEEETGKKVNTILQLRLHPTIINLKHQIESRHEKVFCELTYVTPRGKWYNASWKGDEKKSGGIATNIGIHFFDTLSWIFGVCEKSMVKFNRQDEAAGLLNFEKGHVDWHLSVKGDKPERSLRVEDTVIDFTDGFNSLHNLSYQMILEGKGFGISDTMNAIEIVSKIRNERTQH